MGTVSKCWPFLFNGKVVFKPEIPGPSAPRGHYGTRPCVPPYGPTGSRSNLLPANWSAGKPLRPLRHALPNNGLYQPSETVSKCWPFLFLVRGIKAVWLSVFLPPACAPARPIVPVILPDNPGHLPGWCAWRKLGSAGRGSAVHV